MRRSQAFVVARKRNPVSDYGALVCHAHSVRRGAQLAFTGMNADFDVNSGATLHLCSRVSTRRGLRFPMSMRPSAESGAACRQIVRKYMSGVRMEQAGNHHR